MSFNKPQHSTQNTTKRFLIDDYSAHDQDVSGHGYQSTADVFGDETTHGIHYRTLSWPMVAFLMITEIVTYGTLSLPSALAVVGLVPGVILITFLGAFGLYTSLILVDFKLRHPEVHNMGDAGYILLSHIRLGWLGREVLSLGTILFAISAVGGQLIAADAALGSLSDNRLCQLWYTGIFAIPTILLSLPRALNMSLSWLSAVATISIIVASIVAMIGAGLEKPAQWEVAISSNFYAAFSSITNPVFAYAGHFMFFPLLSEMRNPRDAPKAAWCLQTVATTFYVIFAVVMYIYIGNSLPSPAYSGLKPVWAKAAWGLAIPNLLVAGALYNHTAAKIIFIRIFRGSRHLHDNTVLGWTVWVSLVLLVTGAGFALATGVPIFGYLVSWFTYGIAGWFWLHDTQQGLNGGRGGWSELVRRPIMTSINILTVLSGAFICIGGLYVFIKAIDDAYASGAVGTPFSCGGT
ncbi:Hypothetical protein R9X50_00547600 [Acrodontium crateriforme]|uniref:Amino acid transporter transmembrane domain-containing protein n=1 Tax=Acrodontium crateriforme TaxID=150365 RepID=A0AAQ3RAW8_9PEZI|nr:Hypothetical protein R9X50_00547600 [Acrodontium crateriforme]